MNNQQTPLNCQQVNQWDLVQYLSSLGFIPAKVRGAQYWYHSPLRIERTPSFKVDRRLNCWYDHGLGRGGTLVDFALLYYGCSISELLHQFRDKNPVSFHPHKPSSTPAQEATKSIDVVNVAPLHSRTLLRYLKNRGIDPRIALQYCHEVDFKLYEKQYNAIGFPNDAGGYELRNPWFKGSTSPKAITTIKASQKESQKLLVFEGFFDFLSYQNLSRKEPPAQNHYLVLNSLAFLESSRALMEGYSHISLYLDRDNSGREWTQKVCAWSVKFKDESHLYKDFKDLSAWQEAQVKKGQKRKGIAR